MQTRGFLLSPFSGSLISLLKPSDLPLVDRQARTGFINRLVFRAVLHQETFVYVARIPEIKSQINRRVKGIAQESSLAAVRIAPEQPRPLPIRPIGPLESFFTTQLDFVLP